jgi:fructose-1-phosphate kinase PfkB-like protein
MAVIDAQGPALIEALNARPALVKHNLVELEATVGRKVEDDKAIKSAMRQVHESGAVRVVVTAGKRRLWL